MIAERQRLARSARVGRDEDVDDRFGHSPVDRWKAVDGSTESVSSEAPVSKSLESVDQLRCSDGGRYYANVRIGSFAEQIEMPASDVEGDHVATDDPVLWFVRDSGSDVGESDEPQLLCD